MHNYVDIGVLRINIAISQGTSATRDVVVDSSSGKVRNGGVTRPGTEPFRKVDISAPRNSILFRLETFENVYRSIAKNNIFQTNISRFFVFDLDIRIKEKIG